MPVITTRFFGSFSARVNTTVQQPCCVAEERDMAQRSRKCTSQGGGCGETYLAWHAAHVFGEPAGALQRTKSASLYLMHTAVDSFSTGLQHSLLKWHSHERFLGFL